LSRRSSGSWRQLRRKTQTSATVTSNGTKIEHATITAVHVLAV
jgi:hypothetical protein